MYRPVPAQVDLLELERGVLEFWRDRKVFARSLERSAGRPEWVFYEGPPTANGMPGAHHIEARVFKDVFPRYKTMKGFHVERKAGWDCHGLPVELAVEQELGFAGKRDIEDYGVAEFNARCRESVTRHTDAFGRLTERMGYWVDMDDAYRTMDPAYIESVWWSLKEIFERGLLVEDFRVAPWCPRCGTGLSDHELAQGYETVTDPAVYVRFPLASGPLAGRAALLVWTTTPWTLVSNVAVAAHPGVTYVVATDGAESLVVAEPLLAAALGAGWAATGESFTGAQMERWAYEPPFGLLDVPGAHYVVNGGYVTTEDGTGLVHQAPAFGADDLATCRAYELPMVNPVRPDGRFEAGLPLVGGAFFKDADAALVADLEARGRLLRAGGYEHSYPHCWRCHTPLLYYAQPSWYIRTTRVRDALLRENEATDWHPGSLKHGRYGDWLAGNVDWALSRSRYWGTPLPIWRCPAGHLTCVGSLAELGERAGRDLGGLDPHRPYIDEVSLACHCGATAHRVPEVIDAWYDSGAMPFAQHGHPHRGSGAFAARYPADYICEAVDQTRGWFYTLMAIGTLVFDRSPYRTVVVLGHILAEDGRKMSKHLGNVLDPMALLERHGADAVRWFMAAVGSPWSARRVGDTAIQEVVRKVLLTYWNTVAFQSLYARAAGWTPDAPVPAGARPVLDRWLLGELNVLVAEVDAALDGFDPQRAGRLLAGFIDDLSNWYVRRARRRFWRGDPAALATLHEAIVTVTRLMAPLTPFVTERVWQDLVVPTTAEAPDSVHLAAYPVADTALLDRALARRMALLRRLVELGRAARADAGVKTRQPLARVLVSAAALDGPDALGADLLELLADELNVQRVEPLHGSLVDVSAKASFRPLGRRFGPRVQEIAAAIAAADAAALGAALRESGAATLRVGAEDVTLGPDDVLLTETPREGWAVAGDAGLSVALDVHITPQLRRAGIAREVIRRVQEARKAAGLDVADRIELRYAATDPQAAAALGEHAAAIAEEVLATVLAAAGGPPWAAAVPHEAPGLTFWLRRAGSST
jgi:isoleucyl-tRNA synthetase